MWRFLVNVFLHELWTPDVAHRIYTSTGLHRRICSCTSSCVKYFISTNIYTHIWSTSKQIVLYVYINMPCSRHLCLKDGFHQKCVAWFSFTFTVIAAFGNDHTAFLCPEASWWCCVKNETDQVLTCVLAEEEVKGRLPTCSGLVDRCYKCASKTHHHSWLK